MENQFLFQKMTLHAKKSLKEAESIAQKLKRLAVDPECLFLAIFFETGSIGNTLLRSLGITRELLVKNFSLTGSPAMLNQKIIISPELKKVVTRAFSLASELKYPYVGTEHLIYALLENPTPAIQTILLKVKAPENAADTFLRSEAGNEPLPFLSKVFDLPEISLSRGKRGSLATPALDQFCTNLMEEVKKREEVIIGRDKEIDRLITILGRKNKNNPVLIGDPGVGKTALVSGLARRIQSGEVPTDLENARILVLDLALLVAGTSFRGEFEARLKEVVREATEHKEVILFIDEIHSIVGAGNLSGGLDAANILKPALSRGELRCIGATTFGEYKKHIEKDPALERRFQPIKVSEPTPEEAKEILRGIKASYEKFHNLSITPEAIDQAVELSVRYIQDRFLPDKAIDLLDETASAIRNRGKNFDNLKKVRLLEKERELIVEEKNKLVAKENYNSAIVLRGREKKITDQIANLKELSRQAEARFQISVSGNDIINTVAKTTGVPKEKIATFQKKRLAPALERNLNAQIIGQNKVTKIIDAVLARSMSGIANPDRPIGSFLFLGPTGVGKTLTAKVLAKELFGSEEALVRIDMSEFMERHNVSRLIGAPAGYVGYEEGGKLTEAVRHQPYCLILFDEIEKAHPDVWNLLLQILEDGMLTDAEGRKINFRNTIIILTSNIGTAEFTTSAKMGFETTVKDKSGKSKPTLPNFTELTTKVLSELKREVKPEVLNRLDNVLVFAPLDQKAIEKITALELKKLAIRLRSQGKTCLFQPKVISFIAQKSFAFEQGARLVRKNVQELVEDAIAQALVRGKIKKNKITVGIKNNTVKIS